MNWTLWSQQVDAIVRLELKRYILGRRWIGIYFLALAPVFLLLVRALTVGGRMSPPLLSNAYAIFFKFFLLRFAIFFSCAVIFTQMFRGEVLEKTLHYYLLAPVRREVLALGKYTAGLVASIILFGSSTIATYLLMFLASPSGSAFAFSAEGMSHLARYVAVVMLACLGYGAIFLLFGIFFKNPAGVTAALLLWESLSSLLPPALQKLSVVYYLQSLYPVVTSRGAFAIATEPAPAFIAIPGLILFTLAVLAVAGWKIRQMEVTYSAD